MHLLELALLTPAPEGLVDVVPMRELARQRGATPPPDNTGKFAGNAASLQLMRSAEVNYIISLTCDKSHPVWATSTAAKIIHNY